MKATLIAITALVLSAATAHASNDDVSEFNHFAGAKQFELTPRIALGLGSSTPRDSSTAGYDHAYATGLLIHAAAEYGLAPVLAIGADIGMSTTSLRDDGGVNDNHRTNTSGFDDITLYARGGAHVGTGMIVYGLDATVSPEKSITNSHGDTNSASGGFALDPYLGYEAKIQKVGIFGGRFHYRYQGDIKNRDETNSPATESTTKGGDAEGVSAFYEYSMPRLVTFGGALIYDHQENTKSAGTSNNDHNSQIGLRFYTPLRFSKMIELIPRIDYTHYIVSDSYPAKDINNWILQVAGRFSF